MSLLYGRQLENRTHYFKDSLESDFVTSTLEKNRKFGIMRET